ncbi:hypothetical protein [Lysinibacillus sp. ZYM-1]|uniref:hypothetical protein n=1 Tax=Lysinibacillus sp. ZYM-1 TaxID=1681184 RepID=UPI000B1F752A|nr:hypothetical protein [Lysinibacillus sp. ZYM-1]
MTVYHLGNRVFYDSKTGVKLWETGQVDYVDLEVKSYYPMKYFIASINPETKEPVF